MALEDVAGREGRAQGEGARCFGRDGLWKVSLAAYVRVGFESPGVEERCRRTTLCRAAVIGRYLWPALINVAENVAAGPRCSARLSLGRTHGRRSRTLPVTREETKGKGAHCFGRDGLGKVSPAVHACAIFERPGDVDECWRSFFERPIGGAFQCCNGVERLQRAGSTCGRTHWGQGTVSALTSASGLGPEVTHPLRWRPDWPREQAAPGLRATRILGEREKNLRVRGCFKI